MKLKVLSLFDGISCGMVALERAGIEVERYVSYEIDPCAIKVSESNYPQIEHRGDVTKADFSEYKDFDLVIGGSPCTHWSIAKTDGKREVTNSGIGWDLFSQFVRALKEIKPKFFLYENNQSINQSIKDSISNELCVKPITINSSLVSAQNRKRCYWTNIPGVIQPADKGILLSDVIDFSKLSFRDCGKWVYSKWETSSKKIKLHQLKDINDLKSHTLTTSRTHPMNYYLNEDKTQYCNLSVNNWEILQTLPIGYVDNIGIKQTSKYKCIGNGWTVDVIVHILSFIK